MNYNDKKFIGKMIRNARKKAGLNQAQLAEKLGMTDKNLGNIENGKQFPQVNNFLKLIEILNLSIEDFGIKTETKLANSSKQELLRLILTASQKEYDTYLEIIKILRVVINSK